MYTPAALHMIAKHALKWGVLDDVPNAADTLKNLYNSLASLRNSCNLLFSRPHCFLRDQLRIEVDGCPPEDVSLNMWLGFSLKENSGEANCFPRALLSRWSSVSQGQR